VMQGGTTEQEQQNDVQKALYLKWPQRHQN
jgi:hypothetical protein